MNSERAFEYIRAALNAGRMGQAYIIEGSLSGDAGAVIEEISMAVMCGRDDPYCGTCRNCLQVRNRTHPDLLRVEPRKKSRIISIEQIRNLEESVYRTPFCADYKVCVIFAADRMKDEAANALLKTLEEPPGDTIFLLLTDSPQFLLPTVRSRCRIISVVDREVERKDEYAVRLMDILEDQMCDFPVAGGIGMAQRVLDLFSEVMQSATASVKAEIKADSRDEDKETENARVGAKYRELRKDLMRVMILWYRDVFLLVSGCGETGIVNLSRMDSLRKIAAGLDYRRALGNVNRIELMNLRLEMNISEKAVLGSGLAMLYRG